MTGDATQTPVSDPNAMAGTQPMGDQEAAPTQAAEPAQDQTMGTTPITGEAGTEATNTTKGDNSGQPQG